MIAGVRGSGASDNSEAFEEREDLVGWLVSAGGVPHVGHATLPSPGDEHEFLDWISDFYPHRLDRNRPLWEMALLDGLAHGGVGGGVEKHHCPADALRVEAPPCAYVS